MLCKYSGIRESVCSTPNGFRINQSLAQYASSKEHVKKIDTFLPHGNDITEQ